MTRITVTRLDDGAFGVEVGEASMHRVTIPDSFLEEMGLGDADRETVVRESFAFLLQREPPTSILPEFSLDVIERYFPEYREELPRRLGHGA